MPLLGEVCGTPLGFRRHAAATSASFSNSRRLHSPGKPCELPSRASTALLGPACPSATLQRHHLPLPVGQSWRHRNLEMPALEALPVGTPLHSASLQCESGSFPLKLAPAGSVKARPSRGRVSCQAGKEVFQGVYGQWSVEDSDRVEVLLYRAALNVTAFSLFAAALPALLPPGFWGTPQALDALSATGVFPSPLPSIPLDVFFWAGSGGLGVALLLIHIYVTPIKRALQALWAAGIAGALLVSWINQQSETPSPSLVLYVLDHPASIWAVGPAFAALTGLVFKEGLCYGKLEAALLVFIIPSLLLGHLSGVLNADVERPLLAACVLLSTVFALRKFTQPLKDDIGDKSVFLFQAMPPQEQEELLSKLKAQERESI